MNYGRALNDGKFIKSLENTLIFVTSTVAITLSIGFFLYVLCLGCQTTRVSLFLLLIPSLALPELLPLFYLFFMANQVLSINFTLFRSDLSQLIG